jgi:aryl-alcohol dehydrogenase-like predicted oxidoreductase
VLSNQVAYSLMVRSPEADLIPFAESSGRVIIAFSPLAHGLLSGRYHRVNRPLNRVRTGSPLFGPEGLERTTELIATLREVASAHDATAAQIALAWAIRSPAVTAIPGASSIGQLESNVAAADIELADDEYQALTAASDQFRPDTVADVPGRRRFRHGLSALKHTAVGGWFLSKTIGHDYRLAHFRRGVRQGAPV